MLPCDGVSTGLGGWMVGDADTSGEAPPPLEDPEGELWSVGAAVGAGVGGVRLPGRGTTAGGSSWSDSISVLSPPSHTHPP